MGSENLCEKFKICVKKMVDRQLLELSFGFAIFLIDTTTISNIRDMGKKRWTKMKEREEQSESGTRREINRKNRY